MIELQTLFSILIFVPLLCYSYTYSNSQEDLSQLYYEALNQDPIDFDYLNSFRSEADLAAEDKLPESILKARQEHYRAVSGYGTIKKVTVNKARFVEGVAYVDVLIEYETFNPAEFTARFVKVNGAWKIEG